jgi:hypothetical protein
MLTFIGLCIVISLSEFKVANRHKTTTQITQNINRITPL